MGAEVCRRAKAWETRRPIRLELGRNLSQARSRGRQWFRRRDHLGWPLSLLIGILKRIKSKQDEVKKTKAEGHLLPKLDAFEKEVQATRKQVEAWVAVPMDLKNPPLEPLAPVAEVKADFEAEIKAMKVAVAERKLQAQPVGPRFSCFVISLSWNPYAQIRFGLER